MKLFAIYDTIALNSIDKQSWYPRNDLYNETDILEQVITSSARTILRISFWEADLHS